MDDLMKMSDSGDGLWICLEGVVEDGSGGAEKAAVRPLGDALALLMACDACKHVQ